MLIGKHFALLGAHGKIVHQRNGFPAFRYDVGDQRACLRLKPYGLLICITVFAHQTFKTLWIYITDHIPHGRLRIFQNAQDTANQTQFPLIVLVAGDRHDRWIGRHNILHAFGAALHAVIIDVHWIGIDGRLRMPVGADKLMIHGVDIQRHEILVRIKAPISHFIGKRRIFAYQCIGIMHIRQLADEGLMLIDRDQTVFKPLKPIIHII